MSKYANFAEAMVGTSYKIGVASPKWAWSANFFTRALMSQPPYINFPRSAPDAIFDTGRV